MSKKIMILSGSPRKNGNTNTVVGWFIEGAREAGAEVELIDAASLKSKFNGCIACLGCQKSDKFECEVDDEIKPVLAQIPEKDVLVFATPVYFFGPNAQLKLILDRMYSLIKFKPDTGEIVHNLKHIKLGLISTGGGDINGGLHIVEQTFSTLASFNGSTLESLLVPFASITSDAIRYDKELQERAFAFGRRLAM